MRHQHRAERSFAGPDRERLGHGGHPQSRRFGHPRCLAAGLAGAPAGPGDRRIPCPPAVRCRWRLAGLAGPEQRGLAHAAGPARRFHRRECLRGPSSAGGRRDSLAWRRPAAWSHGDCPRRAGGRPTTRREPAGRPSPVAFGDAPVARGRGRGQGLRLPGAARGLGLCPARHRGRGLRPGGGAARGSAGVSSARGRELDDAGRGPGWGLWLQPSGRDP